MAQGDYRAYPAAAAGVATTSSATAWVDGTEVTLVPASTITTGFYITGLWIQPEDSAGSDTTYQTIFKLLVGGTEKVILPFSWRTDTALQQYKPPITPQWLAEPVEVAANSAVTMKSASSVQRTYRVKLLYLEGVAAGGTTHELAGTLAGTSTLTGDALRTGGLAGTSAGSGATTGDVLRTAGLTGTSAATGATTGDLTGTFTLGGTLAATGSVTGLLLANLSGFLNTTSTVTGELSVTFVLASQSDGLGAVGFPILPSDDLYPDDDTLPGTGPGRLSINWALGGTAAALLSLEAGETPLEGSITAVGNIGFWVLPADTLFPSSTLYPGLTGSELLHTDIDPGAQLKPPEEGITAIEGEIKPFEAVVVPDFDVEFKPEEDPHTVAVATLKGR